MLRLLVSRVAGGLAGGLGLLLCLFADLHRNGATGGDGDHGEKVADHQSSASAIAVAATAPMLPPADLPMMNEAFGV